MREHSENNNSAFNVNNRSDLVLVYVLFDEIYSHVFLKSTIAVQPFGTCGNSAHLPPSLSLSLRASPTCTAWGSSTAT